MVRFWYLQALTAQVRVLDHRMSEYRCENQRLADELTNVKKKYLSQKKLHRWCWSLYDIISAGQEDCCVHPVCHQPKQVQYQATDGPAGSSAPPQQQVQLYWRRLQGWESYEAMMPDTILLISWADFLSFSVMISIQAWIIKIDFCCQIEWCSSDHLLQKNLLWIECYWNKVGSSDSIKSKVNTPHHIMMVGCAMHGEHKSCDILCSLNVTNSLWEPRLCLFICDILDISNQSQNRMHFYLYFRKKPDWNENISTKFDRISHTKWMHLLLRIWKILWKYAETHIWAYTL